MRLTTLRAAVLSPVALDDALPDGVIGRVEGIALVYDEVDDHGTTFARGCLDRTARERVASGKVRLFFDHGGAQFTGAYDTRLHVGTVRGLVDVDLPTGKKGAHIVADVFDTAHGRACHDYLKSVQATRGETGLSIGFRPSRPSVRVRVDGMDREQFVEVALSEVSVTAMQSVPGAVVTAVRAAAAPLDYTPILRGIHADVGDDAFRALVAHVVPTLGNANGTTDSDAGGTAPDSDAATGDSPPARSDVPAPVPFTERLAFVRAAFTL